MNRCQLTARAWDCRRELWGRATKGAAGAAGPTLGHRCSQGFDKSVVDATTGAYTLAVTSEARRTLALIRRCVEDDRYALAVHFTQRMEQRGLFWPDVQAVMDASEDVWSEGMDRYNRPKWIICGEAANGDEIEIVCAIEMDESETEFITLYWED